MAKKAVNKNAMAVKKNAIRKSALILISVCVSFAMDGDVIAQKRERQLKFNIRVCARLRPLPQDAVTQRSRVVIPLHQRLQLIQSRQHCNRTDSLRRLWEPRGGLTDAWARANATVPRGAEVEVDREDEDVEMEQSGRGDGGFRETDADQEVSACILATAGGEGGHVLMCCPSGGGIRRFTMDNVLTVAATQAETYAATANEAVKQFLAGQNACIFAYGQTGSGKSHSMFGATDEASCSVTSSAQDACAEAGIVPRACSEVLAEASAIRARGGRASVSLSFVELYGETITDLLADDAHTPSTDASLQSVAAAARCSAVGPKAVVAAAVLRGRHSTPLHCAEECAQALARGVSSRKRAATALNQRSSRAHTVIVLHLETCQVGLAATQGALDNAALDTRVGEQSEGPGFVAF